MTEINDSRHIHGTVNFYRLSRKFVDESTMPEEASQVMYYSLTIGHHLGIVDCLKSEMVCSGHEYLEWIQGLPEDSDAFNKMKGFFTFGEITIMPEHIHMLALAFDKLSPAHQTEKSRQLTHGLMDILTAIHSEPSMYLMIRSDQ